MPILDNYSTQNGYTPQGELRCYADRVTLTVTNNPILAQFVVMEKENRHPEAFDFDPHERRMILGAWTWNTADFNGRRIAGVRVRSAVPGKPAIVTISA